MIRSPDGRHGILVGVAAAFFGVSAYGGDISNTTVGGCGWHLELARPHSAQILMTVPLDRDQPRFSLSYTHSVFLTPVESGYRIDDGTIVQDLELFTDPGYGMESVDDNDQQHLQQDGDWLRLVLDRAIPNLVVRVQTTQNNRITVPTPVDLGQRFGDGPISFRPTWGCSE